MKFPCCPATNASALVQPLLMRCCPSAIRWFVMSVVIDAIKAMHRCGLWPHISVESCKGIFPTLTDMNATTTPAEKLSLVGIFASLSHVTPTPKFRRMRQAMLAVQTPSDFSFQASARMGARHIASLYKNFTTTVTTAVIAGMSRIVKIGSKFDYCQSPQSMAIRQVGSIPHNSPIPYFAIYRALFPE